MDDDECSNKYFGYEATQLKMTAPEACHVVGGGRYQSSTPDLFPYRGWNLVSLFPIHLSLGNSPNGKDY